MHTDDTGWRVGGRADFAGVLVCDRGKSYDAEELADVAQQKCLSHLLRNASNVAEKKTGQAKQFSLKLKDRLREAMALRAAKVQLDTGEYRQQAEAIEEELTRHLRNRILRDHDNQRLLNGVGAQQDRGNLLRFLQQENVEATNNRAERGARAFEAFTSVIQTLRKTTTSAIGTAFAELLAPAMTTSP